MKNRNLQVALLVILIIGLGLRKDKLNHNRAEGLQSEQGVAQEASANVRELASFPLSSPSPSEEPKSNSDFHVKKEEPLSDVPLQDLMITIKPKFDENSSIYFNPAYFNVGVVELGSYESYQKDKDDYEHSDKSKPESEDHLDPKYTTHGFSNFKVGDYRIEPNYQINPLHYFYVFQLRLKRECHPHCSSDISKKEKAQISLYSLDTAIASGFISEEFRSSAPYLAAKEAYIKQED